MYNKVCKCGIEFVATGPAALYCQECRHLRCLEVKEYNRKRSHSYKVKNGLIKNPGIGSGNATGKGQDNPLYKHGKYVFETLRNEIKLQRRYCERCEKDLINATRYLWVVHHKDHNHWNHSIENLELLCKRCHQIEHECWKAFTKAQRLSRKGVGASVPKSVDSY